uniref:N-acetylglucosaminylphosphatidylinositol deacetylase n=1 Tax=Calcidiscus leptoporus TaxID=127549 RepID=A0A7S0NV42_9EUKA
MFFMPTLCALSSCGIALHLLSLTSGNADGLGAARHAELMLVGAAVGAERVTVLNRTDFADGFAEEWNLSAASDAVVQYVKEAGVYFDKVLTFDEFGASHHPNHVDTHLAVRHAAHRLRKLAGTFLNLRTRTWAQVCMERAQAIMLSLAVHLCWRKTPSKARIRAAALLSRHSCCASWRAMGCHATQWKWFRKLHVLFSQYTYVNIIDVVWDTRFAHEASL